MIAFAVITAVVTAVFNLIPFFEDTSFRDIAVNPEAWLLFAMLIVMNCESRKEAVIKTFVFFLISQPLIYLIEAVFGPMGFAVFVYYKYWFLITLLTVPAAALAYQVKKKGWLGAITLSVAVAILGYMAAVYFRSLRVTFPNHLLSLIFCLVVAIGMIILFIDDLKPRLMSLAVLVAVIVITLCMTKPTLTYDIDLEDGNWTYVIEDESVAQIEANESGGFTVTAGSAGGTTVTFTDESGETKEYYVTVSAGGIYLNEFN